MRSKAFLLATFVLYSMYGNCQTQLLHGAHRTEKRNDSAMQKWRDDGLGQFIHFGIYSTFGGMWNGKHIDTTSGNSAGEFIRGFVPVNVYDNAYKTFNPTKFNATEWAKLAKKMGAKSMYFTTKHHDGFCLWPTKYTDYNISNTPYKKDIVKEVVDAYNKEGIDVFLYYSILDWHHPLCHTTLKTAKDSADNELFKIFVKNQLFELVKNYPTIKGLWFDGTWDDFWKKSGAFSDSLEQELKALNPDLIIGSRFRADEYGSRHIDKNGNMMGDYWQAFERKEPKNYEETKGRDWEFITTIGWNGWGYSEKWIGHKKTVNELLELVVDAVSMDGHSVINFGPKGDGSFRSEEIEIMNGIGNWMQVNSTAIYNADRAKGWIKQDWGYITQNNKNNKIYLSVFNIPVSYALKITAPKNIKITNATILGGKGITQIQKVDGLDYLIHIPQIIYNSPIVIELETEKAKTSVRDNGALM